MPFKQHTTHDLDTEMLVLVFGLLPFTSLLTLSLVCKRWNSAASDPSWKPELVACAWGEANVSGLGVSRKRPTILDFSFSHQIWKLVRPYPTYSEYSDMETGACPCGGLVLG